jgi:NAD-dependent histone deacetylase SIR2
MNFRLYPHERSPKVLEANDLQSLAKYMKSDSCQNVFLMVIASLSFHVSYMGLIQGYVVRCR